MTLLKPKLSNFPAYPSLPPNARHGYRCSSIPTMEEKVRASECFDKNVLIAAHMAELHDAYVLEMATHPGSVVHELAVAAQSSAATLNGLKTLSLTQLKVGKVHRRHVLPGAFCAKTLCRKTRNGHVVVNVLEDEEGFATPIHLYNALQRSDGGTAQAQRMFPQHARVAVRDPYLTRLSDGEVVLLVEKMTDLVLLWLPENLDYGDGDSSVKLRHRRDQVASFPSEHQDENQNPNAGRDFLPFKPGRAMAESRTNSKEERNSCSRSSAVLLRSMLNGSRNAQQSYRWIESAQRRASVEAKKRAVDGDGDGGSKKRAEELADQVAAMARRNFLAQAMADTIAVGIEARKEEHVVAMFVTADAVRKEVRSENHRRIHEENDGSECTSSCKSSSEVRSIELDSSEGETTDEIWLNETKEGAESAQKKGGEDAIDAGREGDTQKNGEEDDVAAAEEGGDTETKGGEDAIAAAGEEEVDPKTTSEEDAIAAAGEEQVDPKTTSEEDTIAAAGEEQGTVPMVVDAMAMASMGEEEATSLREKGNFLFKRGQYMLAAEMYKRAAEKARKEENREEEVMGLSNRAEVWLRLGSYSKAAQDAEAAIALLLMEAETGVGSAGVACNIIGIATSHTGGIACNTSSGASNISGISSNDDDTPAQTGGAASKTTYSSLTLAKALFRKARALAGLQLYHDAIVALETARRLAPVHRDLTEFLDACRHRLNSTSSASLKPSSRRRRRRSEKNNSLS